MTEFGSVAAADLRERSGSEEERGYPQTICLNEEANLPEMIGFAARRLVEQVECKLEEDRGDAEREAETPPSPAAVDACLSLAKHLAPHLALAIRLKWGAFTEEDGGISLVVQSLVTDRRLNCRIGSDGSSVSTIRIDEHMHAETTAISVDDAKPKELAAWVTSRA
jgi:hypothetical protein